MRTLKSCRHLVASLILAGTAAAQSSNPAYYFTTLAGVEHRGSVDGTGIAARFNNPHGTAVDASGNVYVADSGNHTIRKITSAGAVSTLAGLPGIPGSSDGTGSAARFDYPQAVAVDAAGNVFVADAGNFTIRKITPAGTVTTLAGSPGQNGKVDATGSAARFRFDHFSGLIGMVIDNAGNLFVTDGDIRKVTPAGVVTTFITQNATVPFGSDTYPIGDASSLGIDAADNLYLNGSMQAVVKITPAGVPSVTGTATTGTISSLTADSAGHVYQTDQFQDTSLVLYRDTTALASNGGSNLLTFSVDGTHGSLGKPVGPSVDGTGNFYYSDLNTHNIRTVASGTISTLAGETDYGIADGAGPVARFDQPAGIALDGSGNVYVADSISSTIRKVTPAGVVSTIAGSAYTTGATDGNGAAARFNQPKSVAIDAAGNLLVVDYGNHAIRKISPSGDVTTLAGLAGQSGSADGTGSAARFNFPSGITLDAGGNIFVCDWGNQTIRQITPAGAVTTFAGAVVANNRTRTDGGGTSARFTSPWSICSDGAGNLYVAERTMSPPDGALRKITAAGDVSTIHFGTDDKNYSNNPMVAANPVTGDVFVTSNGNTTQIKPTGEATTVVITNGAAYIQVSPHPASHGLLYGGLAVGANGVLYYADGTDTIRQATPLVQAGAGLSFSSQPTGGTINEGDTLTLTASASGTSPITYQWLKDGLEIPGSTSSTLIFTGAVADNSGLYTVSAQNASGRILSSGARVTVNTKPQIVEELSKRSGFSSRTISAGASIPLSIIVRGSPTPDFQWQKDSVNRAGGQTYSVLSFLPGFENVLQLNNLSIADTGSYSVQVSNSAGSVTSVSVSLIVVPQITTQPSAQTASPGSDVTFNVAASGSSTLKYQWQKGGVNLAGATGTTLTLKSVTTADAGTYQVVVSDASITASTVTSNSAVLSVTGAQAPANKTVTTGHGASFSAGGATGTIQWQISTNGGTSWSNLANGGVYSGTTTSVLTLASVDSSLNNAQYRYVATDHGTVTSSASTTLTVASAFFPFPTAVASDAQGNLFIADANANTIQKVTSAGVVSLLAGTNGTAGSADGTGSAARFNQPGGLRVTSSGTVFVTDTANGTIRSITTSGAVTTLAGTAGTRGNADGTGAAASFSAPTGIVLDASGNLFVTDAKNNTVRKITPAGTVSTFAGTANVTGAVDANGSAARFNFPTGIAVDANGNFFVTDTTNNIIRKISSTGDVSTFAGLAGVSGSTDGDGINALFNHPGGLVIDGTGNLFVADTGNSTIRKISSAGSVSTFAGLPGIAGLQDGSGSMAFFNQPQALGIGTDGNLYVADTGNAALRKITSTGSVTTLTFTAASADGGSASTGSGGTTGTGSTGTGSSNGGSTSTPSSSSGGGGGALGSVFTLLLGALGAARAFVASPRKNQGKF